MLRKTSSLLFLSALGIIGSATAYAHKAAPTPDNTVNNNFAVTIPDLRPGFQYSFAILALKPGATNLNYVIYNKELPEQSPGWTEREIRPGSSAAVQVGVSYIFPGGRDISLDWTHLNSSDSTATSADSFNFFLGPDYEIGPSGIAIRNATGNAQFKYDVINLSAGQFIDVGQHVGFHFFGGLSDAFLREQVTATYSGNVLSGTYAGPFSTQQTVTANFTGVGPRLGMEGTYTMDCGFGFFGEAAVSALIGNSYAKTSYISSGQELMIKFGQSVNYQTIVDQNVTQVVPGFDTQLGVSYRRLFKKGEMLEVRAGYQAAVYVNAINQYVPGTLVADESIETGGIFVATMNHTQSNYSVQGPFLKATLQF